MLDEALQRKLADWRPDSPGQPLTVADAGGAWSATVEAEAVDGLGVRLRRLTVRPVTAAVTAPLREQADRLARDVTGLLEPLRVVEVDGGAGSAQLRSRVPAAVTGGVAYYEVDRKSDGTTSLQRYQAGDGRRQDVPFTLTHEALGKIARDFAG
jgi:hypothetical protein